MRMIKLLAALAALFAAGVVSADAVTEYTSQTNWQPAVNNVTTYIDNGRP